VSWRTIGLAVLCVAATSAWSDEFLPMSVAELETLLASEPVKIISTRRSREKIASDVTLRGKLEFADGQVLEAKIRPAERGGGTFNNEPRYELAAYELQKLFLDPPDYVVPPTALKVFTATEFAAHSDAKPTFRPADDVLCVVQAWLKGVVNPADVLDSARAAAEPEYLRQVGNLNILTVAINHMDSNRGNFLRSKSELPPRFFSIDNGVAFNSERSDRGDVWRKLRVEKLPAAAIERVKRIDIGALEARLGVLAEWRVVNGHMVTAPKGENINPMRGVRLKDDVIQLGLTRNEIKAIDKRFANILRDIEKGKVSTF